MFYCDMGKDATLISTLKGRRKVGRYLIVDRIELPFGISYNARTVATLTANGNLKWWKHRDRAVSALLTKDEQKEIMLQVLKSEKW
jgi:hypothetical protein